MSKDRDRRNKTLLLVAMSAAKAREISVPTIAISVNIMRLETTRRTRLVRAVAVVVAAEAVETDLLVADKEVDIKTMPMVARRTSLTRKAVRVVVAAVDVVVARITTASSSSTSTPRSVVVVRDATMTGVSTKRVNLTSSVKALAVTTRGPT
jgi:hypothetical protein